MTLHQQWVAFLTIVTKEVRRFLRIWPQTLLPPAITMTLYFVIFGNLVGSRIGEMGGFDYMQYIEEMLVSPMSPFVILSGFVVGGMVRGIMVGGIVTTVSLFFTDLNVQHAWITLLVVAMTSALFALGGFINAIFANNFDDISIIPNFILTPLTYLGGVFYSIDLLSEFWRTVTLVNPIVYMVNAFRYGVLGVSDVNVYASLGAIFAFTVVFFVLALWLLRRGTGIRG